MAIRRREKLDHTAELAAWSMTFRTGFDFLKALPKIGVPITKASVGRRTGVAKSARPDVPPGHQPPRDRVEDAWRRLGREFLDSLPDDAKETWAERELGQPEIRTTAARARALKKGKSND